MKKLLLWFVCFTSFSTCLAAPPDVTFKQLPFGTSLEDFKKEFPGAQCEAQDARTIVCTGRTDFFDRKSTFTAFLGSKGLDMVYVRIYAQDMDELFKTAGKSLLDRFGAFKQGRPGTFLAWDVKGDNQQGVILIKCNGEERCVDQDLPGIMIHLIDARFQVKSGKDF